MSCRSCGHNRHAIERQRFWKPENNSGCCPGALLGCDQPSKAKEGSPLWEWEQKYGKVHNQITTILGEDGRFVQTFEKVICSKPKTKKRKICCSVSYRISN